MVDGPLPPSVAVAVGVLVVVLARHLATHVFHLVNVSAIATAAVLLLPELVARLGHDAAFTARIFVRRSSVITVILGANLFFAAVLTAVDPPWLIAEFDWMAASTFAVTGGIVGGVIRFLFVRYLQKAIEGVPTEAVEVTLLAMVSVYLWLFPASERHNIFAAAYLVGIASGFMVHFVLRGLVQRAAGATRRRVLMLTLLGGIHGPRLYPRELNAIELYVHQEWRPLRRLLENTQGEMRTTALTIIHASMEYAQGEFDRAYRVVDDGLSEPNRAEDMITYLLLLKTLCLTDLGRGPEAMNTIEEALRRTPDCMLANCLSALRAVEQVPLDRPPTAAERLSITRASEQMRRALQLAEQDQMAFWNIAIEQAVPQSMAFWSVAVAQAVPVTATFLLDAWAYVALRNGDLHVSKAVLLHCVRTDPKFASPYLHLGEWYLIQRAYVKHRETRQMISRRASICLHIAVQLEAGRDSLVRRRAQWLLDHLDES
jgi:hypothetical protein